jgi:hypothetical protein
VTVCIGRSLCGTKAVILEVAAPSQASRRQLSRPQGAPAARPTNVHFAGQEHSFAEKSPPGELIDSHAAVFGCPQLVPERGALATLASDYQHMLDDADPFEALLQRCRVIQKKANVLATASRLDVG